MADFFDLDGPERDRWGRPLLLPRNSSTKMPYTRASTLSNYLSDQSYLHTWRSRYLARSLGRHADLAMLAGAEPYTTGFDKGDDKENRASGRRLDDIIARALDRVGIHEKADYGTAAHLLSEPDNDGQVHSGVEGPSLIDRDVAAFKAKMEFLSIQILDTEVFCANDALQAAGTFDHLVYHPAYGIVVLDKKFGQKFEGSKFAVQLVVYGDADPYNWEHDVRMDLSRYIAALGWDPSLLNREVGLIAHTPGQTGECEITPVNLTYGRQAATHAVWVRDHFRKGDDWKVKTLE